MIPLRIQWCNLISAAIGAMVSTESGAQEEGGATGASAAAVPETGGGAEQSAE